MYSFRNDYSEGAYPEILKRLSEENKKQHLGYGEDEICKEAKKRIHQKLKNDECDIHFLVGGTQTNLTVISSALRPFEAVITVDSGHINVHETGAIEATGHKVIVVKGKDGKITPDGIHQAVKIHTDEHMVKPKMVYISNATEIGTIYTKKELEEIRKVCDEYKLYLFMDGARLGAALTSSENDLRFEDLCTYCDVFYIGGTKNGALFGEAIVIVSDKLKSDFRYMIKQRGGMLAKGWLIGVQFAELMKDNVYLELADHANKLAQKMQSRLEELGISFFIKTSTNQIFPVLPNEMLEKLSEYIDYQIWEPYDETHTIVRFVTSWATDGKEVEEIIKLFENLIK
ncbi:low specificity L-threonine aldolase [Erysipelotrichaceae bacterium HCN-30851]